MPVCAHLLKKCEDAWSNRYKGPFWRGILGDLTPFFLQNGPFEAKIAPSVPQNRVKWGAIGGEYGCAMPFSPLATAAKAGGLVAAKTLSPPCLKARKSIYF